jgi:hypothetical protein
MTIAEEEKFIAFWEYDLFPHFLYGTVSKFHEDTGQVETVEYGAGSRFTPIKVFKSGPHTDRIIESLNSLKKELQEETDKIKMTACTKLGTLMKANKLYTSRALK